MKDVPAEALAILAGPVVPMAALVEIQFPAGTVAFTTASCDLEWDGVTYRGAHGLGTMGQVVDAPGEIRGLQFTLAAVSSAVVSLALDGSDEWQGVPVIIRVAILDPDDHSVVHASIEWTGTGDTMAIEKNGDSSTVHATAESTAVDLLRGVSSTYSDADQQASHAGDRAFEYVVSQSNKELTWPARSFFTK